MRDRADVRVVVANGSGLDGVAGDNADLLRFIGYSQTIATNALSRVEVTTIYYREGFEPEAIRLGGDLGLFTPRFPLGDDTISFDDDQGDLIAVVGRDARR
ncbi:MAG: LytR family transcriptional regulator [Ilumatobacter sp.]|nr:MAG: LytR family transcriptional regulator [Ilumatobacter sp.]